MYWNDAPKRIWEYNPNMKLICILRNPMERAVAAYFHRMKNGRLPIKNVNIGMMEVIENPKSKDYEMVIDFGLYHKHTKNYLKVFPRENFLFLT